MIADVMLESSTVTSRLCSFVLQTHCTLGHLLFVCHSGKHMQLLKYSPLSEGQRILITFFRLSAQEAAKPRSLQPVQDLDQPIA